MYIVGARVCILFFSYYSLRSLKIVGVASQASRKVGLVVYFSRYCLSRLLPLYPVFSILCFPCFLSCKSSGHAAVPTIAFVCLFFLQPSESRAFERIVAKYFLFTTSSCHTPSPPPSFVFVSSIVGVGLVSVGSVSPSFL